MSGGSRGAARPMYARVLHLKHMRPGGLACFLLFEGVIGLAVLLSLAELVNWWSVLVLPAIVAGLVKINDIVAGAFSRTDIPRRFTTRKQPGVARGIARVRPDPRRTPDRDDREIIDSINAPTEAIRRQADRRRATNQRQFEKSSSDRRSRSA